VIDKASLQPCNATLPDKASEYVCVSLCMRERVCESLDWLVCFLFLSCVFSLQCFVPFIITAVFSSESTGCRGEEHTHTHTHTHPSLSCKYPLTCRAKAVCLYLLYRGTIKTQQDQKDIEVFFWGRYGS